MPNSIEAVGTAKLKEFLVKQGRKVEKSDNKTFDLIVDGKYSEVKTKKNQYSKLDFISFTDKQYKKILDDKFVVFLVCNVGEPSKIEIFEFNSKLLREFNPKKYTSHEYSKTVLNQILGEKLEK